MRVLPNRTKSNRSSERVRKGPHARTYLLWQILLASLAIDPLIPAITTHRIPAEFAISLATLCAVATLPFLSQGTVHRTLSRLRVIHTRNLDAGSKTIPLSLAMSAGAILLVKMFMFMHLPLVVVLALLLVILTKSRKYLSQISKQSAEDKALFAANPWAKVQRWEHQVIVFATIPLLFARAISVCGALAELPPNDDATRLAFIAISALFLGMLRPERDRFLGICTRCKHPVPIVFQDMGSCLHCDETLRIAYHAWAHRLNLPTHPENSQQEDETAPSGQLHEEKK